MSTDTALVARAGDLLGDLVGIDAPSGHEEEVRAYLETFLRGEGLACQTDDAGNLIATLPGDGPPLLLNAHLDRVPPGRGHAPVVRDGRMRSDGTTNLGADDAAGIAIILLVVQQLMRRGRPYPHLVLLFTVGEEVGLTGATAFDPAPWQLAEGIVFDNAGPPGAVVTRGAGYVAFDAVLRGVSGHPGKDLAGTVSAIEVFRRLRLPVGSLDGDSTRISLGTVAGGTARNAIPAELRLAGEVRTLLSGVPLVRLLASIEQDFLDAARALGGTAEVELAPHGAGYALDPDEPLLAAWRAARAAAGRPCGALTTFIGSDANALRRRGLRVFTVSTGVEDEHTLDESIALAPLAELVATTLDLLDRYRGADRGAARTERSP